MNNISDITTILRRVVRYLIAIMLFCYPFILYWGIEHGYLRWVMGILIIVLLLRLIALPNALKQLQGLTKLITGLGILLITASWLLNQYQWMLYYPVIVNLAMLSLFSYSLYKPPSIITRLAMLKHPKLSLAGRKYTNNVTRVWVIFFSFNGAVALLTCLAGNMQWWTLYNGFISYLLIALVMGGEWLIRQSKHP